MHNMNIFSLRDGFTSGRFSARDLLCSLRAKIAAEAANNAWIYLLSEAELEPYLAALEQTSPERLPLYGIPFALKDNIDLKAVPTTAACPDFAYTPEQSAPVVQQLIDAGAVPLGKTNLDQFATGLVGTRSPYGEGKNVFNPDYISGGSSAGSAIATACGQVSFALGTDTAGSGRVPAALNHIIGHKPSKGLLSTRGVVPACRTLDCVSIFTGTAAEAACLLDITAEYDSQDPYARRNPPGNRSRYLGPAEGRFTFGVPDSLEFFGDDSTRQLFRRAVSALEALGGEARPLPFTPFVEAAKLLYEGPWVTERWLATAGVAADSMLPVIRSIIGAGEGKSAEELFRAQYRLADLKRQCDDLIADLDFVVTPTTPTVYSRAQVQADPVQSNSRLGTYTNFMNLLDYAATAVPVGFLPCGASWGVTLFSEAFSDIRLLAYADRLHRACCQSVGATGTALAGLAEACSAQAAPNTVDVVVCGAHLQGQPLNWQLSERRGRLITQTTTSPAYRLYALSDGKRPALIREPGKGTAVEVELWRLPIEHFGSFVAGIPAPLGIGQVELADGRWCSGFICDHFGLEGARDISEYGGWRSWLAAQ